MPVTKWGIPAAAGCGRRGDREMQGCGERDWGSRHLSPEGTGEPEDCPCARRDHRPIRPGNGSRAAARASPRSTIVALPARPEKSSRRQWSTPGRRRAGAAGASSPRRAFQPAFAASRPEPRHRPSRSSLEKETDMVDKDRIKGSAEQAKGKVKEWAGKATGDKKTEAEGKGEQVKGKVRNTFGGLKDAARGK